MSKAKKKGGSVFAVFVVIILMLSVVFTIAANLIFAGDRVPSFFGYYLYLQETGDMDPDIPENSFVLAKEAQQTSLQPGSKVLCYLSDGSMALRVIYNIDVNEDGSTNYYPGTALEQGTELAIPRGNIFAVCTWASKEVYTVIRFATSVVGMMSMLVAPCIILIIMLLVKIAKSSREELDEDYLFEEDEIVEMSHKSRRRSNQSPLFDPEKPIESDANLEKKKASISENFSEKPVNEDSPYQKAVQERTMRFKKIEQEDIERANREESVRSIPAPTPKLQEEFSSRPAAKPESVHSQQPVHTPQPIDQTGYVPTHSSDVPIVRSDEPEEPRRSAAPNIDDVLDPGEIRAAKSGQKYNREIASTGSIDDLIAALENEKKKL